ncbi:hypothetical protein F4808DRAFT_429001 [Astrocystis sublimbata]|nr:hypothetical protein F4808DRAFT_429001 [Astrocystis sublimbata]
MRSSVLSLLSVAALAAADITPGHIVIESATGNACQPLSNITVDVHIEHDFMDTSVLKRVTSLYQVDAEYTYFCFGIKPDGTFFSDNYFGLDMPLHLSDTGVELAGITCRVE